MRGSKTAGRLEDHLQVLIVDDQALIVGILQFHTGTSHDLLKNRERAQNIAQVLPLEEQFCFLGWFVRTSLHFFQRSFICVCFRHERLDQLAVAKLAFEELPAEQAKRSSSSEANAMLSSSMLQLAGDAAACRTNWV